MHETCRKEGVLMPVNVNEIEPDEKIVEIEMERLREFRNHPFKVKADAQMLQLIESISKYGILNPLIVRPLPEGVYEIISGHRRKYAAQHLGFRKMSVIIRVLRDDDAVINMVDGHFTSLLGDASILKEVEGTFDVVLANINRNILLADMPAFAEKMKPHSTLLLSGIYEQDVPLLVEKAASLGLTKKAQQHDGDWACLRFEKN